MASLYDVVTKPLDVAAHVWSDALRQAGPAPAGDPAALRAHATFLNSQAELLRAQATRVRTRRSVLEFEGTAARQHHQRVEGLLAKLEERSHAVDVLAQQVGARADRLEHEYWQYRLRVLKSLADEVL